MATYLLTWNPSKWHWDNLAKESNRVKNGKGEKGRWSCGRTKKIVKGDRFFLLKQGSKLPKGIIGSGFINKSPYYDYHWNGSKEAALYVGIEFDTLLNPNVDEILERDFLIKDKVFSKVNWNTQTSGIEIIPEIAGELEEIWQSFLEKDEIYLPEEIKESVLFYEGAVKQILVNSYERNSTARRICIEKYNSICFICRFDFNTIYGKDIAENYIHVHHLKQLSEISEKYKVNPIEDLRPVCPNCHAIIHKRNPPYSIDEVKQFIENQKRLAK